MSSIFNANNTDWVTGNYKIACGQHPALFDSIHNLHPKLFELYKQQKAQDWNENEVDLTNDRMDFQTCSKNNYNVMIQTLAFQWAADSVASRAIAPLFAPFITDPTVWAALSKNSEIEVLHALTYSEIVRTAIPNAREALELAMEEQAVLERAEKVYEYFDYVAKVGAEITLGTTELTSKRAKHAFITGMVALLSLEQIEFLSSFAATFALAETGAFQGVAKLVAKIAADEQLHSAVDLYILKGMQIQEPELMEELKPELKAMLDDVVRAEFNWNTFLFSEGRSIVGLNKVLLDEWVMYNAQIPYKVLGIEPSFELIEKNPIPWIETWFNLDLVQAAAQESDVTNYLLNTVVDDLGEDVLDFY